MKLMNHCHSISTLSLSPGKAPEGGKDDEGEKPEPTTHELSMFDWVRAWIEDGGCPHLRRVTVKAYLPRYYYWIPCFLIWLTVSICHPSLLSLLRILGILQVLHQLHQASHLWWEATSLEAKWVQKIELPCRHLRSRGSLKLYKARMLESSTSSGPPFSKRCWILPSTIVSGLTTNEYKC